MQAANTRTSTMRSFFPIEVYYGWPVPENEQNELHSESGGLLGCGMVGKPENAVTSLYVHVPFCAHKCSYCAFYSEASNGEVIERYVAAVIKELELVAADLQPRTIFFGGGTPSLLKLAQWERILAAMQRRHLAT